MLPMDALSAAPTKTFTYFNGSWSEGNRPILGVRTHGAWLGSVVFDGARVFDGVAPDFDLHFERVNRSAEFMLLDPVVPVDHWLHLVAEGRSFFTPNAALYVRPMYWPEQGFGGGVRFDPTTTNWCLTIYEAPMPAPRGGTVTLSPFRRPTREVAPVEAKASCLYANGARALIEAARCGFDNCLMLDADGHIAEFANSNAFMVKDDVVFTPAPNDNFLDGITRRRVIGLLCDAGIEVLERQLSYSDFLSADEIFSTGNFQKLAPITGIDGRDLRPGPIFQQARGLYWDFAHDRSRAAPLRAAS